MGKFVNRSGQIFGEWTIVKRSGSRLGRPVWSVRCTCGFEDIRSIEGIVSGKSKSCGCVSGCQFVDRTGQRFGRWVIVKQVGHNKHGHIAWQCKCDCGTESERGINTIVRGGSKSCGCMALKGKNHPHWNGGRVSQRGYIKIHMPSHPNAIKCGYVMEHVMVMSKHLGRPLRNEETVHHKNGIRSDNKIENLELWTSNHPSGQRVSDLVLWAKEILKTYKEEGL